MEILYGNHDTSAQCRRIFNLVKKGAKTSHFLWYWFCINCSLRALDHCRERRLAETAAGIEQLSQHDGKGTVHTDKKKRKFPSYIRKFRMEQFQSHI